MVRQLPNDATITVDPVDGNGGILTVGGTAVDTKDYTALATGKPVESTSTFDVALAVATVTVNAAGDDYVGQEILLLGTLFGGQDGA